MLLLRVSAASFPQRYPLGQLVPSGRPRYLKDNHINGFRVRVLHLARSPYAYLHLEYPESIADHRVRTAPRVAIHIPARIALDGGTADVVIVDLSNAGVRVSMSGNDIEVGTTSQLRFDHEFAGQTESPDVACEVGLAFQQVPN